MLMEVLFVVTDVLPLLCVTYCHKQTFEEIHFQLEFAIREQNNAVNTPVREEERSMAVYMSLLTESEAPYDKGGPHTTQQDTIVTRDCEDMHNIIRQGS